VPLVAPEQGASLPWCKDTACSRSRFLSITYQARMVSARDNGIYTGSGLRGVIPYVHYVTAMFLSQVCL
jgi:hypothetical protein